ENLCFPIPQTKNAPLTGTFSYLLTYDITHDKPALWDRWDSYHTKIQILFRNFIINPFCQKCQTHAHDINGYPFTRTTMPDIIITAALRNEIKRTASPFLKSLRPELIRLIP